MTTAPPAGLFLAAAVPPCAAAIAATIARPSPAPPSDLARPVSGRRNRFEGVAEVGIGPESAASSTATYAT